MSVCKITVVAGDHHCGKSAIGNALYRSHQIRVGNKYRSELLVVDEAEVMKSVVDTFKTLTNTSTDLSPFLRRSVKGTAPAPLVSLTHTLDRLFWEFVNHLASQCDAHLIVVGRLMSFTQQPELIEQHSFADIAVNWIQVKTNMLNRQINATQCTSPFHADIPIATTPPISEALQSLLGDKNFHVVEVNRPISEVDLDSIVFSLDLGKGWMPPKGEFV